MADKTPRTAAQNVRTIMFFLEGFQSGWPVETKDGRVSVPSRNEKGVTLREALDKNFKVNGFSESEIDTALKDFDAYIDALNEQTKAIRASTSVSSTPQLVMSLPEKTADVRAKISSYVLKNNLEASGAQVTILNSHDRFPRDHYVLGASGVARPLVITTLNTGNDEAAANSRNSAIAKTIHELEKLGVATADIAGGDIAYSINKALASFNLQLNSSLDPRGDERTVGGDILQHTQSNTVFIGINLNATGQPDKEQLQAAQTLSKSLGMQLVTVPKAQAKPFYHLDTFMSVLPDGSVVLLPDATTPQARTAIQQAIKGHDMLELPVKSGESQTLANDRRSFATNLITVNGNSFTPNALPEMKEFFKNHGLNLFEGPYKWGGSGPHCQTNFIKRGKADGKSDIAQLVPEGLTQLAFNDMQNTPEQFNANITAKLGGKEPTQLG